MHRQFDPEMKKSCDFLIRGIGLGIRAINDLRLSVHGITNPQGRLLGIIHDELQKGHDVSRKSLQDMTSVSGPAITSLLNGLEKKGLILRSPGKNDGRTMDLQVTQRGEDLIAEMTTVLKSTEGLITKGMTKKEITLFISLLQRAYQNVIEVK